MPHCSRRLIATKPEAGSLHCCSAHRGLDRICLHFSRNANLGHNLSHNLSYDDKVNQCTNVHTCPYLYLYHLVSSCTAQCFILGAAASAMRRRRCHRCNTTLKARDSDRCSGGRTPRADGRALQVGHGAEAAPPTQLLLSCC